MVRPGDVVTLRRSTTQWTVGRLLGEGGQGTVHELVPQDGSARRLALKWYAARSVSEKQRLAITAVAARHSPGPMFLWPMEVISAPDGSFGYVMPIRPPEFVGLGEMLKGRVDVTLSLAVRLSLGIAHGFLLLHSQGLCYRDISFGNVSFDPRTGAILICDNDNVGVDGESESGVLGTRRFMAPEIVRGEAKPGSETDLYSLAVLIFYVLMVHHPLLGRRELDYPCLDRDAEGDLFGDRPLFVFDPADDANAPDPVEHQTVLANWAIHPDPVKRLFVQAFGEGIRDPQRRVRESVWRATLARLLDAVRTCDACGRENFSGPGVPTTCWGCSAALPPPMRLVFPHTELALGAGTRIYRHHVAKDYDYERTVGEVTRHPTRDVWGLRNTGSTTWEARIPGREPTVIEPGQAVALVPDTVLRLGGVEARLAT